MFGTNRNYEKLLMFTKRDNKTSFSFCSDGIRPTVMDDEIETPTRGIAFLLYGAETHTIAGFLFSREEPAKTVFFARSTNRRH